MREIIAPLKTENGQPVCSCGVQCWAYNKKPEEPCWGSIHVSEDYPGAYTHYCDGHGHFEDGKSYRIIT